jgi:hypothetical protein
MDNALLRMGLYYPGITLEELRRSRGNISQDSRYLGGFGTGDSRVRCRKAKRSTELLCGQVGAI